MTLTKEQAQGDDYRDTIITRIKFRRYDSATDGNAVFIEVNGAKRYCYGPNPSSGANCRKGRQPSDNLPVWS